MLSTHHGFNTSVKRSGHAACWCAALGGVVQFGGWPPSEELSDVVRHEGSGCPLFYMPATTIARHLHRADQRRRADRLETALAPTRQHRLRALLRQGGAGLPPSPSSSSLPSLSAAPSAASETTEEASERGFVYDEGYVSEAASSDSGEERWSSSDSDSSSSSGSGSSSGHAGERASAAGEGAPATAIAADQGGEVSDAAPSSSRPPATDVLLPTITVELLRQVVEEAHDRQTYGIAAATDANAGVAGPTSISSVASASHGHTSVSRSTHVPPSSSPLRGFGATNKNAVDREAPPLQRDTREVRGKYTVRPLRWRRLRPPVAPRTRHGHHLVSCGDRLYVIGGSYWAHGNALATTDMMYDVRRGVWQQINALFPSRFCAALARSNAVPSTRWLPAFSPGSRAAGAAEAMAAQMHDEQVLYYFGGLNYSRSLTNRLFRLWLPQETLEELPQYGAMPRPQFKGLLVCDVQRECTPEQRRSGEKARGRLFYLDGLMDGRPMAPYVRIYSLETGVWVRVCPSPDLVRSQVSLLQYQPQQEDNETSAEQDTSVSASTGSRTAVTVLTRFEMMGGMPSRRGRQRRSRMCYAFDARKERFDYSFGLPVPGLTAHCTVPLPSPVEAMQRRDAHTHGHEVKDDDGGDDDDDALLADGVTTVAAYRAALHTIITQYGAWSLCCGGNEDWSDAEQNSLGTPVSWLYLLAPRTIPMAEVARVQMECRFIPMRVPGAQKDALLEELF